VASKFLRVVVGVVKRKWEAGLMVWVVRKKEEVCLRHWVHWQVENCVGEGR